jgi:hypothetical protein
MNVSVFSDLESDDRSDIVTSYTQAYGSSSVNCSLSTRHLSSSVVVYEKVSVTNSMPDVL